MIEEYYTWEELIELGCPPQLIIQYIFMTKDWVEKETGLRLK
jgi:hypothetical protein